MSNRRRGMSPQSRPILHMDRLPALKNIADPSNPAGKRKEIDNVMKKARNANTNEYWDKKLLEVEEKDPNRWRHTGYKKMYIEGDSSSESEREGNFRYNNSGKNGNNPPVGGGYRGGGGSRSRSRSRSRIRKSPPLSPRSSSMRRSPMQDVGHMRRGHMSPSTSQMNQRRIPPRSPIIEMSGSRGRPRPRSPPEPLDSRSINMRRKSPPMRRSPPNSPRRSSAMVSHNKRAAPILPRSKRPPSPPPKTRNCRSRSNSSMSSCSDDSCSVCSPKHGRPRSRTPSMARSRLGPRSPPPKSQMLHRDYPISTKPRQPQPTTSSSSRRPASPPPPIRPDKYRENKIIRHESRERSRELIMERQPPVETAVKVSRSSRHSPVDPRLQKRPPEPPTVVPSKRKKEKSGEKLRAKIKIEGEKRTKKQHNSSSDSDDSESSESSLPTFTATTRLTLSERFGKMAQWSIDRSNMENMRITKDSAGGALKVMIEEGAEAESPPRRFSYSPAPQGHFPEELAVTAPSGMLSWDDVRVRFEYYKSRGYLRDLDLKDYVKWEEWWYRYQEWLKQERYYEFWERRKHMHARGGGMNRGRGRGGKKIPIQNRLN